jgi:hypothetical protein
MPTADYSGLIASGAPSGTSNDFCLMVSYSNNKSQEADTTRLYAGNTTTISTTYAYVRLYIYIKSGTVINNPVTFSPMLSPANVYNAGFTNYQPYAMSNAELTAKEQANETNILTVANYGGGINVADISKTNFTTGTAGSFTTTLVDDIYTLTGTTTSAGFFNIYYSGNSSVLTVPVGDWIVYPYPLTTAIQLQGAINGTISCYGDANGYMRMTIPQGSTGTWVRMNFAENRDLDGISFRLMIIPKSIYDSGLIPNQPYALSNAELTAKERANETNILLKQNKAIYNELTLASGTYTDYTDVITYTTPANTPCVLIATVFNTGSSPAGVKICAGSSKVMIAKEENTDSSTMYTLTTTGFFTGGNSITVQGKMLGAGTLKASLTAIPISTT